MNYYIIPKNNFNITINLCITSEKIKPYISYSLFFYLNDVYTQLFKIQDETDTLIRENDTMNSSNNSSNSSSNSIEHINQIVNPFEFIHTIVPGSSISVSKVKADSRSFFELMEIFQLFSINDFLSLRQTMNIAHLTPNHSSTNYLLNMLREHHNDFILCEDFDYEKICSIFIKNKFENHLDLFICEFNVTDYTNTDIYIRNMLLIFSIIVKYQAFGGTCIIKIDNIFYKAIVDILFALSALYDKVYLVKPIISSITKSERYLICKKFQPGLIDYTSLLCQIQDKIVKRIINQSFDNQHIASMIQNEIPSYFLNRLEESNAVIGQQQLEAYDQIINIFKNKNKEDKLETLKRNHIQKCINWCEKYQLPHNKFIDKVNIFLTTKKRDLDSDLDLELEEEQTIV
jgi:hypothetical protein